MRPQHRLILDGFGSLMMDLVRLTRSALSLPGLSGSARDVENNVRRLCEALDEPEDDATPIDELVRHAFDSVLALGQLLDDDVETDDRWITDRVSLVRLEVSDLLDAMSPLVTAVARSLRETLLQDAPLESVLARASERD